MPEKEIKTEETAAQAEVEKEETTAQPEKKEETCCGGDTCCCGDSKPVVGSDLPLEHTPLKHISLCLKMSSVIPVLYFLFSVFLRLKDYSQVPAEYLGQFWKVVAFSAFVNLIVCALLAMLLYAAGECIRVLVEAAQNIRDMRDASLCKNEPCQDCAD